MYEQDHATSNRPKGKPTRQAPSRKKPKICPLKQRGEPGKPGPDSTMSQSNKTIDIERTTTNALLVSNIYNIVPSHTVHTHSTYTTTVRPPKQTMFSLGKKRYADTEEKKEKARNNLEPHTTSPWGGDQPPDRTKPDQTGRDQIRSDQISLTAASIYDELLYILKYVLTCPWMLWHMFVY